ncbi:hypothetical protein MMPV_003835 [Pyropia vietnamensis]
MRAVVVAAMVTATIGRACVLCNLSSAVGAPVVPDRGGATPPAAPRLMSLLAAATRAGRPERLAVAAAFRLGAHFPAAAPRSEVEAAADEAGANRLLWTSQRRLQASFDGDDMSTIAAGMPGRGGDNAGTSVDGTAFPADSSEAGTGGVGEGSPPPEASIAYFLQVSPANVRLLPRLVRAIYHPNNVYGVHYDVKISAADAKAATEGMAAALDAGRGGSRQRPPRGTTTTPNDGSATPRPTLPPNIHLMERRAITYRGVTTVLNTLDGMELLAKVDGRWDYFINLSAADYPLLSATAVRRLLGRDDVRARAANFLTFHPAESWAAATTSRFSRMTLDLGVAAPSGATAPTASVVADAVAAAAASRLGVPPTTSPSPGAAAMPGVPPQSAETTLYRTGIDNPLLASRPGPLAKGGAWMILTRDFVTYALTSSDARRALLTVSTGLSAAEHYFPTLLSASPVYRSTIVPHGLRAIYWDAPTVPNGAPAPAAASKSATTLGAPGTTGAAAAEGAAGEEPLPVVQHPRVLDAVSHTGGVAPGGAGGSGGNGEGEDFLDRIAACPYLFARKFSKPTSPLLTYIDRHMNGLAGEAANATAVEEVVKRANRHLDWLLAEAPLPERVTL